MKECCLIFKENMYTLPLPRYSDNKYTFDMYCPQCGEELSTETTEPKESGKVIPCVYKGVTEWCSCENHDKHYLGDLDHPYCRICHRPIKPAPKEVKEIEPIAGGMAVSREWIVNKLNELIKAFNKHLKAVKQ